MIIKTTEIQVRIQHKGLTITANGRQLNSGYCSDQDSIDGDDVFGFIRQYENLLLEVEKAWIAAGISNLEDIKEQKVTELIKELAGLNDAPSQGSK